MYCTLEISKRYPAGDRGLAVIAEYVCLDAVETLKGGMECFWLKGEILPKSHS